MIRRINRYIGHAAVVIVAGWLITLGALIWADLRQPWTQLSGFIPDDEYRLCDAVPLVLDYSRDYAPRISKVEREIIGPDGISRKAYNVETASYSAPVTNNGRVTFWFKLPCQNLPPGEYTYIGVVEYKRYLLPNDRVVVPPNQVKFEVVM